MRERKREGEGSEGEGSPSAISIYDLIISDICQASIVEIILIIFSLKIYKYCDIVTMIDQSYLSRHVCQHGRGYIVRCQTLSFSLTCEDPDKNLIILRFRFQNSPST